LPEDAEMKASEGILGPLEAFIVLYQDFFPTTTFLKHAKVRRDVR
jgi:hypothetical protein